MKVFKFGGGVLNSAEAVKKIPSVINLYPDDPLIIVVSAFGKTTNALEDLISARLEQKNTEVIFQKIFDYHREITKGLFSPGYTSEKDFGTGLREMLKQELPASPAEFYDRVICFGELISSQIVSEFLEREGYQPFWADIRDVIKTDSNFRDAAVDWQSSRKKAGMILAPVLGKAGRNRPIIVTQGFIGSDALGRSTSLGREGSDYTASILANLLDANEVITWKDVPGILNADPKHFRQTVKLDQISYAEATELAYYGAKVIHPKTVKPLQNKGIPMQVRSFGHPSEPGTLINADATTDTSIPSFIFKFDQVLISLTTRDLSFINEQVFNDVFSLLSRLFLHVNIIQNSALTLSFCVDNHPNTEKLIAGLQEYYTVKYNRGLELITIRHANEKASELVLQGKEVLLEQQNRTVVQYVVR